MKLFVLNVIFRVVKNLYFLCPISKVRYAHTDSSPVLVGNKSFQPKVLLVLSKLYTFGRELIAENFWMHAVTGIPNFSSRD